MSETEFPPVSPGWPAPMCETCRFWTRDYGRLTSETDAECRRHAPTPACYDASGDAFPSLNAAWPITEADDWCGDHRPMPKASP
ncbi:MAG: hypothetical protein N2688_03670 [Burkholderiaceae bacterium]|nr:hypothetical protein [Burkholderiaceae bacterium]